MEEHKEHDHAHHEHHEHHHTEHHKRKPTFAPIHIILAVLIAVVLLVNTIQILGVNNILSGEEPAKPEIKATLITADCKECTDTQALFTQLVGSKEFDAEDATLSMTDSYAKKLMEKYSITKLPAIVVEGDVETLKLEGFVKTDDALVFQSLAPYYDVMSGSVKGKVTIMFITADPAMCPSCETKPWLGDSLKQAGVLIESETTYSSISKMGSDLISMYHITKLPAYVMSKDAGEYEQIALAWTQYGTIESDGAMVMRNLQAPYYDLAEKKVRGQLTMIGLVDATCKECYNVSVHEQIFQSNFGVVFSDKKLYDIATAEGKNLLKQYNITKVPTIVVKGDVDAFPSLKQAWPQVGNVAADGAYVFHKVEVLQGLTYKDLSTGKVVKAGQ